MSVFCFLRKPVYMLKEQLPYASKNDDSFFEAYGHDQKYQAQLSTFLSANDKFY